MNWHRRSLCLKHYDYSQAGCYFVTICTQERLHLFGEIVDGEMVCGDAGRMVHTLWYEIIDDFHNVHLHEFVIMPNHIHGIIEIVGASLVGAINVDNSNSNIKMTSRASTRGAPTVGDVVGAFKSKTTNQYIKMVKNGTLPPFNKRIWQRNYHEHVIRDDVDYERVAMYTVNNPLTWEDDIFAKP